MYLGDSCHSCGEAFGHLAMLRTFIQAAFCRPEERRRKPNSLLSSHTFCTMPSRQAIAQIEVRAAKQVVQSSSTRGHLDVADYVKRSGEARSERRGLNKLRYVHLRNSRRSGLYETFTRSGLKASKITTVGSWVDAFSSPQMVPSMARNIRSKFPGKGWRGLVLIIPKSKTPR